MVLFSFILNTVIPQKIIRYNPLCDMALDIFFRMVAKEGLRRSAATTFSSPSVVAFILVVFVGVFLSLAEGGPAAVRALDGGQGR